MCGPCCLSTLWLAACVNTRDRGGKGKRRPNRTIADQYTFAYPECSAYPEYSKINFWATIFPHLDQNLSIHLNQIQFFVPVTTPFVMVVTTFVMVVTTLSPVSSLSFRSPCGCFGLAVSSSRSCRPRQPSCGGRRWMRTVRRCGRGSPTPVLLLCTQTHPAKDVGAASACAARADTVHRSCVLAHEVTLPRPCTRAGLNGDPDAWNSSSYDGYGTEYSGYNGFAVTGMETSEPTGGMRIRGWVRIRGWGVGCST